MLWRQFFSGIATDAGLGLFIYWLFCGLVDRIILFTHLELIFFLSKALRVGCQMCQEGFQGIGGKTGKIPSA